jgi:hypothetical protein
MYNFRDFLGKEAKFDAYLHGDIKETLQRIDVSASGEVPLKVVGRTSLIMKFVK